MLKPPVWKWEIAIVLFSRRIVGGGVCSGANGGAVRRQKIQGCDGTRNGGRRRRVRSLRPAVDSRSGRPETLSLYAARLQAKIPDEFWLVGADGLRRDGDDGGDESVAQILAAGRRKSAPRCRPVWWKSGAARRTLRRTASGFRWPCCWRAIRASFSARPPRRSGRAKCGSARCSVPGAIANGAEAINLAREIRSPHADNRLPRSR